MSPEEFESFRERAIRDYAAENVRAGNWSPDQADAEAGRVYLAAVVEGVSQAFVEFWQSAQRNRSA